MKNSSINSMSYSNRAQSPEFCGLFKQKQQKVTVKNLIWTVVFLVLTIVGVAAISALNGYLDTNVDSSAAAIGIVVAFAAIPVFGIIFLVNCIKTVFSAVQANKIPKMGSVDCVVSEKKQWDSRTTDEHGYEAKRDNYSITLESNEGKKFKVTGHQAMVVLPYVNEGDKVRYHSGFTYPIELFDKTKGNICVFCGTHNDTQNDICKKCNKPMLI